MNAGRSLLAFIMMASLFTACSGASRTSSVPAVSAVSTKSTVSLGKRVYYSRSYLRAHPDLLWGPNAGRKTNAIVYQPPSNLLYSDGPVQSVPIVYLIFWGWQSSSDTTADPDAMAPYLFKFFTAVGGSPWINIDTQYYSTAQGKITNPVGQLGGVWYDGSKPSSSYTDSDIAAEALAGASHFGYNSNANYFVVTPHNYHNGRFHNAVVCLPWHNDEFRRKRRRIYRLPLRSRCRFHVRDGLCEFTGHA